MKNIFEISNFNIIEDDENFYFFRALNRADSKDLHDGIILDENGIFVRIRTDRERYEEDLENGAPKYKAEDEVSLEQVFDHIKMHYRKDTNCISLSSNANVLIDYGRGNYNDEYIMIKVPKQEMGQNVKFAGQYMLQEVEKRINDFVNNLDEENEEILKIIEELRKIDNASSLDELKELTKVVFNSKKINTSKSMMKKEITYKAPHARLSNYKTLSDEQNLEKNKIIAKLTVLERKTSLKKIIPFVSNTKLIECIGSAFSSMELIHYGDIPGKQIKNVPSILMDIFSLLQQIENKDMPYLTELKKEIIQFVENGSQIENIENSILDKGYSLKDNITIDEMYELTGGRVEYGKANSIVNDLFYLSKSQLRARELANVLRGITGNNEKYENIIEYISKTTFEIEPEIITRRSNKGYRISESVSLDVKSGELSIVDEIRQLSQEQQIEILENSGLSNVNEIMTNFFSKVEKESKISREEYYAGAIIDLYNWQEIGIEEFTIEQRNDLINKLVEKNCMQIYKNLKNAGVDEKDIPLYIINIISNEKLNSENYIDFINENRGSLSKKISIPKLEELLGYNNIEGTEIVLRDYQKIAIEKTDEIFEEKKFVSVVLPTGAGKSFVALAEFLEHKDEPMLYLAPQTEILEQMKDDIVEYVHGKKETIGKTKDEIVAEVFPNLKFEAYSGLIAKRGEKIINEKYSFIVLDELHRTGAKEWEKKLNELLDNQDENVRVLGITATPIRDMDDRNMADEIAKKLGYTDEDIRAEKHIAMYMDLIDAIKLGLVVNPKVVSCEYMLENDGSMENLLNQINLIEDENERKEKLEQYEVLRRNLESAQGIPEILKQNLKSGGKYIVFIPVFDEVQIEDEDGNIISDKIGIAKIKEYERKLLEYLKESGLSQKYYSMLGDYSNKKNEEQLKAFENDNSEDVKFMIVMNKANEGLHIKGIDGIVWFRPIDENSKILFLQQLGRVIYSEDPENPTPDEERPIIIDLVNNTLKVNIDKYIKNNTKRDDLELLTIIVDWIQMHNKFPNIDSSNKIEQKYAGTLYRIQQKYIKYVNELEVAKINEFIEKIIDKGAEIDLWGIELSKKSAESINKILEVNSFELKGVLRDYSELADFNRKSPVERLLEIAVILNDNGVDLKKLKISKKIEGKQRKLLLKELSQDGVDIQKIIEENGLDGDFKFGVQMANLREVYRNQKKLKVTDEQIELAKKLGIINENKKSVIAQTLEVSKILFENGIDLSKLQTSKKTKGKRVEFLLKDLKIEGIDIRKIIEENELDENFPIGRYFRAVRSSYNETGKCSKITKEEREEAERLGIILEPQKTLIAQTLEITRTLKENGVDLSKVKINKKTKGVIKNFLLKELKVDDVDIQEIIEKHKLDGEFPIGYGINQVRRAYNGNGNCKITEEEKKEAKKQGLILEKSKTAVEETLEMVKLLKKYGIDVNSLQLSKTHKGNTRFILLKEVQVEGIDIKKIIQENNLDENFELGKRIIGTRNAYRGTGTNLITEQQKQEIDELGLFKEEKQSMAKEVIAVLKILKENGIDLNKLKYSFIKNGKSNFLVLKDIVQAEIDIDKIIEENGLDGEYPLGRKVQRLKQVYNGTSTGNITEDDKREIDKLGLQIKKGPKRTGKEIVEATISAIKDVDLLEQEERALQQLVEKNKEGGINLDEQS